MTTMKTQTAINQIAENIFKYLIDEQCILQQAFPDAMNQYESNLNILRTKYPTKQFVSKIENTKACNHKNSKNNKNNSNDSNENNNNNNDNDNSDMDAPAKKKLKRSNLRYVELHMHCFVTQS